MQNRLRDSYRLFADTVKGIIAPVGEAFRASISGNPTLDLYQFDQSHPSLNGSYLAAIVFYETLFQKNVLGNQYNPGVGTADSWYLQQKAHAIVHDSLATWNQGLYHPWAGFLTAINGLVVQFNSQSNTLLNKWYFGDGNTSVLPNPSHTYAAPGTYTVTHVVDSGCKRDSVTKVITVSTSVGIKEQALRTEEILWPNPATNQLYLSETLNSVTARIQINDLGGRLLLDIKCEPEINISGLTPGMYILNYKDNERQFKVKFVKTKN